MSDFSTAALARLGQPENFTIRCWNAATTLLGDIDADQPSLVGQYDSQDGSALALAPADDRVYATGAHYQDASTPPWLQVFQLSDGALVTRTNLAAIDATVLFSFAAIVPASGFVWVGIERPDDGQIWEFDTTGVFQRVVATIPPIDANAIDLHAFAVIDDIVYYAVAQTNTGFGVARWALATQSALTPLVSAVGRYQVIALSRTRDRNIATVGVAKDAGAYLLRTYARDGTLVSQGDIPAFGSFTGCASTADGGAWTSDQNTFPDVLREARHDHR